MARGRLAAEEREERAMPIAVQIQPRLAAFAVIRAMFEEGRRLRERFGEERVYDFSLGNPDAPPPESFRRRLAELAAEPGLNHGYAPVAGLPEARAAVAERLESEQGTPLPADAVVMTVGASGALNVLLRVLCDPGDALVVPAPYFVGYENYAFLAGVRLVPAATDGRFHLDPATIASVLGPRTRAVLVNSPNNPSGAVYGKAELEALGSALEEASARFGRRIYLIADEPYRAITYGVEPAPVFPAYAHSILVNSFSKDPGLAGERLGYLAVHPEAEDAAQIVEAAAVVNSMMVVHAPAFFQRAIARARGIGVDVAHYRRRRDLLCEVLSSAGYAFVPPEGAFYVFPRTPLADDLRFAELLRAERILVSPGRAFGVPGHIRLSFAVPEATIRGAAEGLRRAREAALRETGRPSG